MKMNRIRSLRKASILLLLLAIIGPWAFERINVPAQFPCQPPFIRLEGDFCGTPLPGIAMLFGITSEFFRRLALLISATPSDWPVHVVLPVFLAAIFLVLPLLTTSLVLLGRSRRWRAINLAAWCLAGGISVYIGLINHPQVFWALWGIWLYAVVAAGVVVIESLSPAAPEAYQ